MSCVVNQKGRYIVNKPSGVDSKLMYKWLTENIGSSDGIFAFWEGRCKWVGLISEIAFINEEDAVLFSLRWS